MTRYSGPYSADQAQVCREVVLKILKDGESLREKKIEELKNGVTRGRNSSTFSNSELLRTYRELVLRKEVPESTWFVRKLRKRAVRTLSGIAPISVLTKPFPCPGKCVYCPTERVPAHGKTLFELDSEKKYGPIRIAKKYRVPGALVMPKSYISSEPAAMRALLHSFDPWKQVANRLTSLQNTGHSPDKCELIVMGGTFSFLPKRYQTWFVKRCLQALNGENGARRRIEDVQQANEKAQHRSIGIVLETRPDHMTAGEARRFRRMGCTRVEMGVQTLDDRVSFLTKRGHGKKEVAVATKILRDAGFKICHHMMPGLPGSTPDSDRESFRELYEHPDYKPDYIKIYPCLVTPFSEMEKWFRDGRFKPYSDEELIPLLLDLKKMTPSWVRITRLIRDIPGTAILGGSRQTNLRQHLQELLRKEGTSCRCIRCREIRDEAFDPETVQLKREEYAANDGKEIFLSYTTPDDQLISLLRLRIPSWFFPENPGKPIFPVLRKCAFVRELHTYGELTPIGEQRKSGQHGGWGKKLLREAERIVREEFDILHLAIISGIGVKEYYRKQGYEEDSTYMIKNLILNQC